MEIDTLKVMNSSLGLIGSGIGAYTNLSPIEDIEQYNSQAQQLGNSNYQLGSLQSLADQYAQRNIPQSITGETLYNPSAEERFGQLFSSGMSGFQAGYNFADNFTDNMGTTFIQGGSGYNTASGKGWGDLGNAIEEQASQGKDFSGTGGINMLMKEFNVKGAKYALGGLMLDNGSMINAAAGLGMAGINMGLNAAGNARRRRQAEQDALRYNALRDFAINRNTLDFQRAINDSTDNMFNMAALQMKASGGPLFTNGGIWSNGLTFINNGGTHNENPLEGVPMGIAPDGIPNLVEEGEVIYNDYVFSNRLKANKALLDKYNLPTKYEGKSFAEITKAISKESEERPNDPISKKGLEDSMVKLQIAQEEVREMKQNKKQNMEIPQDTMFDKGGVLVRKWADIPTLEISEDLIYPQRTNRSALIRLGITPKPLSLGVQPSAVQSQDSNINGTNNGTNNFNWASLLRYAPVAVQGITALTDALGKTNKPDYSNPNLIAANTKMTNYIPVGDYLALDRLPIASTIGNKLSSQTAATNAAIQNVAANRASSIHSLLTSSYKGQTAMADAILEAAKYNNTLTQAEATFNKDTNLANSQMGLTADQANQRIALQSAIQQAQMREDIDRTVSAAKSQNLSNFLDSLQGIGREATDTQKLNTLIDSNVFGNMTPEQMQGLLGIMGGLFRANGGKLKRNKRKGLTC